MSHEENDIKIYEEYSNGDSIPNGTSPHESSVNDLNPRDSSPEVCPLAHQLSAAEKTPTHLRLQYDELLWEEKTPTNKVNRHSFGEEPFRSGSVESSGSDLQRAIFERLPSFHLAVPGQDVESDSSQPGSYDIHKTPTNNPPDTTHRHSDSFPSPTLRLRRTFPRSRPVSGDPLSNYNVIPRRKDSFFAPHLLKYGGEFSDSEDDRSVSVTTSYLGDASEEDDEEESCEDDDYLSDLDTTTARSLYFMAYEVKRRLSTVPAGSAGTGFVWWLPGLLWLIAVDNRVGRGWTLLLRLTVVNMRSIVTVVNNGRYYRKHCYCG